MMYLLFQLLLMLLSSQMVERPMILVITATAGYRHESIPTAEESMESLAQEQGIDVSFLRTEEEVQSQLTAERLKTVDAVFFVNTTGELPAAAADVLIKWVRGGGTFVGIHSASDTWHSMPEYVDMLGGEFIGHPPETNATVIVDDPTHMATHTLPPAHELYEEYYYLGRVDPSQLRMLLSLRRRPQPPGGAGYFPLAWQKSFGAGRVLYTALGHRQDVWLSDWFRAHIAGVMKWATRPTARD